MKTLIILSFTFLLITFFSCKKQYIPPNELLISSLYFDNNLQKTIQSDSYFLRIEWMQYPEAGNDLIYKYLYNDSVKQVEPIKFTVANNLNFGRYVISARKGTLSAVTELVYKGGSTQINLILKPEL